MKRTLDDDLMGANAVHLVVDAVAALVEIAFHLKRRIFVWDDADAPAALVGPGIAVAIGQDFVRRIAFMSFAKRTRLATGIDRLIARSNRSLGPFGGNNDPATHNRVFP